MAGAEEPKPYRQAEFERSLLGQPECFMCPTGEVKIQPELSTGAAALTEQRPAERVSYSVWSLCSISYGFSPPTSSAHAHKPQYGVTWADVFFTQFQTRLELKEPGTPLLESDSIITELYG